MYLVLILILFILSSLTFLSLFVWLICLLSQLVPECTAETPTTFGPPLSVHFKVLFFTHQIHICCSCMNNICISHIQIHNWIALHIGGELIQSHRVMSFFFWISFLLLKTSLLPVTLVQELSLAQTELLFGTFFGPFTTLLLHLFHERRYFCGEKATKTCFYILTVFAFNYFV